MDQCSIEDNNIVAFDYIRYITALPSHHQFCSRARTVASISTNAPIGSADTCTVERAGKIVTSLDKRNSE